MRKISPAAEKAITRGLEAAGLRVVDDGKLEPITDPAAALATPCQISGFIYDGLKAFNLCLPEHFAISSGRIEDAELTGTSFNHGTVRGPEIKVFFNGLVEMDGKPQKSAEAALEAAVTRIATMINKPAF